MVGTENEQSILCISFKDFFISKLIKIGTDISTKLNACRTTLFDVPLNAVFRLHRFQPVLPSEALEIINTMRCKTSPIDTIPTVVLKRCAEVFATSLAHLANISFESGIFPSTFKLGHVIPLLKKPGLDKKDPANYRPITNLVTISKILERLVLSRIQPHLHSSGNFSSHQSAYRRCHSTETALLKIVNDINTTMESRSCSILLSLDISAAFDTIDIDRLVGRLDSDFGIGGMALAWLRSYLTGRSCYVAIGDSKSETWICDSGVPQGSVLGPILFSAFVSPISRIPGHFRIQYHQYADDVQLYAELRSTDPAHLQHLSDCVAALTHWFLVNGLQLNASKSEAMILGTRQGMSKLNQATLFDINGETVPVKESIKILGVQLDSALSMNIQVKETVKVCNYHIRALRHVRRSVTFEATKTIVHGLVTARLDYCNSLLLGTSKSNIAKLQHVQNDLARVVLRAPWRSSSKPLLEKLHWLPVPERITYKVAVTTFKAHSCEQPAYLHEMLNNYAPARNLRSEDQSLLQIPFFRSSAACRSFCHAAPTIWNGLKLNTRQATSFGGLKSRLKTELFQSVFH